MERASVTYRGVTISVDNFAATGLLLEKGDGNYFINRSGADCPLVSQDVPRKLIAVPHLREREHNFFIVSIVVERSRMKRRILLRDLRDAINKNKAFIK